MAAVQSEILMILTLILALSEILTELRRNYRD